MHTLERRLLIVISIIAFSVLYVASWYWLYPELFDRSGSPSDHAVHVQQ